MMCMYQEWLTSKRVTLGALGVETIVPADSQCRSCYDVNKPDEISNLQEILLDNSCMVKSDTCRWVNNSCMHLSTSDWFTVWTR